MKNYEKPRAEVVDFTAEQIMDGAGVGGGPGSIDDGAGALPVDE